MEKSLKIIKRTCSSIRDLRVINSVFSPFPEQEEDPDRNCECCRKACLCYSPWLKFQNFMFRVTHDMLFESAVTVCIILNTAFLAVEHHGMSPELKHVLSVGNKVFTTFFTTEAALKLLALSKE